MCQARSSYNWNAIFNAIDNKTDTLDIIYTHFINVVKWHMFVPLDKVKIRDSGSHYITPDIYILLCKYNKL